MKKALFVYGAPNSKEDPAKFNHAVKTNLQIMSQIAIMNGYSPKVIPVSELDPDFTGYQNTEGLLFDYVGHSEGLFMGPFYLEKVISSIEKLKGKKTIVLDACTDSFIEKHIPAEGTSIFGCFDVYFNQLVAMSFFDAIIARGKSLDSLTQETFKEMKHEWIKVKKG